MKRSTSWRGLFIARNEETGDVVAENDILEPGIQMTLDLWQGKSTEQFEKIALEDASNVVISEKVVTMADEIDNSGTDPVGIVTSTALFSSSDMTAATEFATLVGNNGTIIGRAPLSLNADTAYEVQRKDYLGESSDVVPPE